MNQRNNTLIKATTPYDAALEASVEGWNKETIQLITDTLVISETTSKTHVYTAQWDKDPSYTLTAYVQSYDSQLELFHVIVLTK